jgi:transposase
MDLNHFVTQFKIQGGAQTIKNWHDRWDGTINSLERKPTTGRPTILNTRQVKQYITKPIIKKNKQHQSIHYRTLLETIKSKINKSISLRSVQRYGRERA